MGVYQILILIILYIVCAGFSVAVVMDSFDRPNSLTKLIIAMVVTVVFSPIITLFIIGAWLYSIMNYSTE